jgi:thioredoxin-like negative regulator of GroEL
MGLREMRSMTAHTGPANDRQPRESSDPELAALIRRTAEPVVVESYHAGWEKPWRGLSADAWRDLLREFGERVNGAVIETSKNRELAVRYELEVIPTVLVFLQGEVVARFTGRVPVASVIGAVHAALQQARTLESARQELKAAGMAKHILSPVRSILRRRTSEPAKSNLARAG